MAKKAAPAGQQSIFAKDEKPIDMIELDKLELDPENPRFGNADGTKTSQIEILDSIVGDYGIEDVISSLAVNGYFPAEPVIAIKQKKSSKYRVVEGNRRLAACLVLAGEPRAKNQAKRTQSYQELQESHQQPPITQIPVIWFNEGESPKELISYLGVRHLAASMPWDSYAKAAWIARVVRDGDLSLDDISRMTGDQHKTIARLLHGYNVVDQLIKCGLFNPEASYRKGRGSNADFAFSWVPTPSWAIRQCASGLESRTFPAPTLFRKVTSKTPELCFCACSATVTCQMATPQSTTPGRSETTRPQLRTIPASSWFARVTRSTKSRPNCSRQTSAFRKASMKLKRTLGIW